MTKFEEEVNKYNIFERTVYLEGGPKKILIDHFKNWHSDEEFQAEKDARKKEYEIHQDIYSKTSKKLNEAELEIANLKSQLQQQALPVVPECVAEWIEILKTKGLKPLKNPETYGETGFTEEKLQNIVFWISEYQEDYMRAWLDGYTVEKPQLFYLRDELTGQFLAKDNRFKDKDRYFFWTGEDPLTHSIGTAWKLSFTQQEIDSMQTGSYEKIEVTE
ncbi:hypothetical protein BW155_09090 [Lactococcus lactis subsp. lactis]|uniref:DUF1642 domain-containing protein n=1 Tax=Lactococcus lactis TaxID=1358 RepID=UPI000BF84122|nr:DUF1642 domain-containing protein [Lactococcus lactis]MCH5354601.1 DUF1642 domain-containing protein [Lactococcus lactis]PFG91570.1 hypothetical protein BW155_09090 [Lactococcus lactis subsp. lactis]